MNPRSPAPPWMRPARMKRTTDVHLSHSLDARLRLASARRADVRALRQTRQSAVEIDVNLRFDVPRNDPKAHEVAYLRKVVKIGRRKSAS